MATSINSSDLLQVIQQAQSAAKASQTKTVTVDQKQVTIPAPFPSPGDWRDCWIYFLMLDRFAADGNKAPAGTWNQIYNQRQGGTFKGVQAQLSYLAGLGAKAIWLSPVLKNPKPNWDYNYHGYAAQDFLNIDARFASDGTQATAEVELKQLVDEAHARGMYVAFDIVLNHAARVFDYDVSGQTVASFQDASIMNAPLGQEPDIEWLNGYGFPRSDWKNDLPASTALSTDDVVWPTDLQSKLFFRRRGSKLTDKPGPAGFVPGDFDQMRQLVSEYDASVPGQEQTRAIYGVAPVVTILVRAYEYLMAKYDVDAYRIDSVKYVYPDAVRNFGNAMREFALTINKKNFFTFGEIYDDETLVDAFVGRRTDGGEGFGIDAALDFPLFFKLPQVAKCFAPVESIQQVFDNRKAAEAGTLSSHGEAGRYFVSFLDNHDQHERIQNPGTPVSQVTLALVLLFTLQGIPCIYYGTEQGLSGTVKPDGSPDLSANESTREALWGKPAAFDTTYSKYKLIQILASLRSTELALSYGRIYFRQIAGSGFDFGLSTGIGGIVAFSRILSDREVVVIANTSTTQPFHGLVLVDRDLNQNGQQMQGINNSLATVKGTIERIAAARFFDSNGGVTVALAAALTVNLGPGEAQILAPVSP